MTKYDNNIKPIIIIILIIGGLWFISTKMKIQPQATQELEPLRGQTIWEDFESGINPCFVTTIKEDVETYTQEDSPYKCVIYLGACIEHGKVTGYAGNPLVTDGVLKLNAQSFPGGCGSSLYINEPLSSADITLYYGFEPRAFTLGGSWYYNSRIKLSTSYGGIDESSERKQGIMKIYHDFLDPDEIYINIAGRETKSTVSKDKPFVLYITSPVGTGSVNIDEIRYSLPFTTCFMDENITLYVDRFVYPSTIRWAKPRTLAYEPLRFCHDFPSFRFVNGQFWGSDKERNELTRKLSQAEEYTLSEGEEMWVFYLIPYVEGETERCPFGQAWSTWKQQCIQTRFEEEIKLYQCDVKEDCPVPPACEQEGVTCEDNMCVYTGVKCKEEILVRQEIIEIIKERTLPVYVTEKEFFFNSYSHYDDSKNEFNTIESFNIGDKSIKQTPFESFSEPYLTRKCTKDIDTRAITIDNEPEIITEWDMSCKYKIDTSFLKITKIDGFKDVLINGNNKYTIEVQNDFSNFDSKHSGLLFDCYKYTGLQEDLPTERIGVAFDKGINLYTFKIKDDEMAEYICDLTPIIQIDTDREYIFPAEEKKVFTYNVVDEIGVLEEVEPETIVIEKIIEKEVIVTEKFKLSDIPVFVWFIFIGFVIWRLVK